MGKAMGKAVLLYRIGEWTVEPKRGLVRRRDEHVHLEPKAAELLNYLALRSGEVISRAELLDTVWPGVTVGDEVITNAIAKLRRVLEDNPKSPKLIETIPKRGYRLVACVNVDQDTLAIDEEAEETLRNDARPRFNQRSWMVLGAVAVAILTTAMVWQRQSNEDVAQRSTSTQAVSFKPTIAVLPFDNFSDDPSQEYFSDGMTEDLITDISKISSLSVIARHSTFSYKGQSPDIREVGRALGATHLIQGSVRKVGDAIRISVQLIDASNGKHLWAERYDRKLKDVFAIQDEVVTHIVTALSLKLTPNEQVQLASRGTESLQAYDLYMRGREQEGFFNRDAYVEAKRFYESAIALDPGYAEAFAHLAQIHTLNGQFGWVDNNNRADAIALELAQKSVRLDPALPFAHWGLSRILTRGSIGQNDHAIEEMEKAIELDPNYADAYAFLGHLYTYSGRAERALPLIKRAMRINPKFPFWYYHVVGLAQYFLGDYDASVENLEKSVERNPTVFFTRLALAAALAKSGRQEDAEWQVDELYLSGFDKTVETFIEATPVHDEAYRKRFVEGVVQAGLE